MRTLAALLGLALASTALQAQGAPSAPPTRDAARSTQSPPAWLAGCWELRVGPRAVLEQWMAPEGGVMLGMSRTIVRDTVREWEHLFLGPRNDVLTYVARPARQAETAFAATEVSDSALVFENPTHDFPTRILYRRRGADSLVARIEGLRNGQQRGIDFPYRRVSCP